MESINFLGCPVNSLDTNDALEWMDQRIKKSLPSMISVVNANKYWQMANDALLENIIQHSDLVIPEWAVYWGVNKVGKKLKAPVYGIGLLKATLPWAIEKKYSIFFLGAKQEVLNVLGTKLKNDFPELRIAGMHHGYFKTKLDNDQIVNDIVKAKPDILFVALGSPKQEYWIKENLEKIRVPVVMGVGGSFDVIAGLKEDTPSWARGHGLEWLYRLAQDPKSYWRRYLTVNTWFVWAVFREKSHMCFSGS